MGFRKNVVNNLLLNFEVKSKPQIKKVNINEASFKELLAIVYIDYDLTKKLFYIEMKLQKYNQ